MTLSTDWFSSPADSDQSVTARVMSNEGERLKAIRSRRPPFLVRDASSDGGQQELRGERDAEERSR